MTNSVIFDVQHLYYLPQYLPVACALRELGVKVDFVLHQEPGYDEVKTSTLSKKGFNHQFIPDGSSVLSFYQSQNVDWIIFGNKPPFSADEKSILSAKLALMQHGIGPKACYYNVSEFPFDVRFVEGESRLSRLQALFPTRTFVDTGYAKLDPIFDGTEPPRTIEQLGLEKGKLTILYAPTFFPSSIEKFKNDWPLTLKKYNIIIKPHFFSMTKKKYVKQREKIERWASFDNVYVAQKHEFCLVSFMQIADVMLSDASSAIFEFAAMNRPVVWCDFSQTRWSYSGLFKFRLKKRLDSDLSLFHYIAHRATSPNLANELIEQCVVSPHAKSKIRQTITNKMVGKRDGLCSQRIAKYLTK
jgi:hypothetical protein